MLFLLSLLGLASANTWCGKNYKATDPIVPPGGQFPVPSASSEPLLALRCAPAYKPYVSSDGNHAEILVNTPVVYQHIAGAAPFTQNLSDIPVTISIDGKQVGKAEHVPVNASNFAILIDLGGLTPRKESYVVSCSAPGFSATSELAFLPDNENGTVTKFDAWTGGLLAKPIGSPNGDYEPVFPFGYYTSFDDYLAINVSQVDLLKEQGFTVIHPTPTFSNVTALEEVVKRMDEVGMYLMYDMRWTYMNGTSVTEQVDMIKSHPSLLLWYTADEPDGTSDPLNATVNARDLITSLDGGGYHPVSLVLNCDDYYFKEYTEGGEVILQDAYVIGINATYSVVWNTTCTEDYGDCGCDNCVGEFEDISRRMDEYRQRLWILGRELGSVVWAVPQGFGGSSYWSRPPTGKEWVVQALLGVNHGAMGVVSWNDPTTPEMKSASSLLAKSLPSIVPFLFSHKATIHRLVYDRVDVATWTVPGQGTLVITTNMNYQSKTLKWVQIGLGHLNIASNVEIGQGIRQVFSLGASVRQDKGVVLFEAVGSVAFVVPKGHSTRDEL